MNLSIDANSKNSKVTKKIGCLIFDGFNAMDVVGPLEVFAIATEQGGIHYQICMVGLEQKEYTSESGVRIVADSSLNEINHLDTLIIPGGGGARNSALQSSLQDWLLSMLATCRRVVSICTGAYLLASTNALDHKKATTHWHFLDDFQEKFPNINVVEDALFIDHGNIATSAGISSGLDLALKLIEDDCGTTIAVNVARFLVIHYRRAGNQAQYSVPLQRQQNCGKEFSDLTGWILQNLTKDLSIEVLADKTGMSPRNFCRKFKKQMTESPAKYVEILRLDYARQLLTDKDWRLEKISQSCGYRNLDVFRRAFERRFIISPNVYRARFS